MIRVASVGECMIELSEHADGRITRAWGGDTLNTAIYLARLGITVDYVTALGDDAWSDEMLAGWVVEGVGTSRVLRFAGRLPGLYVIQTDARGERRFSYWRDRAPAREIFARPETPALCAALATYSHVYLSGISLSLYGADGRHVLFGALVAAKAQGTRVLFDTNFRPRGWPDRREAKEAYAQAFAAADTIFASTEDLDQVEHPAHYPMLEAHLQRAEVILKLPVPACKVYADGVITEVAAAPVAQVIDTTAAGDSFAAGYMAARLRGASAVDAARAGHRVAGAVVQHRGAIIPRAAMPA